MTCMPAAGGTFRRRASPAGPSSNAIITRMTSPDNDEEVSLEEQWERLMGTLEQVVGKRPADLNGVLFLIGVQELGKGALNFTKEQKQDLMHIGVCEVMSLSGYYSLSGRDKDGWPHYSLTGKLPFADLLGQEQLLKMHVIEYFKRVLF